MLVAPRDPYVKSARAAVGIGTHKFRHRPRYAGYCGARLDLETVDVALVPNLPAEKHQQWGWRDRRRRWNLVAGEVPNSLRFNYIAKL